MHVIKRTWSDGSGYFYEVVQSPTWHGGNYPMVVPPTPAELIAARAAANATTWIEANATIVDTLPAATPLPPSRWGNIV